MRVIIIIIVMGIIDEKGKKKWIRDTFLFSYRLKNNIQNFSTIFCIEILDKTNKDNQIYPRLS